MFEFSRRSRQRVFRSDLEAAFRNLEEFEIVDPEMVPGGPEVETVSLDTLMERVGGFLGLLDELGAIEESIEAEELETEDE